MSENLPINWVITNLGQIANWGSGGTPSRSNPEYFQGNIPWIKTGELGLKYIYSAEEYISEKAILESSAKIFLKGSVCLAMYGATIGKVSILSIDASTNQACAVGFPIQDLLDKEYLYYFLISQKRKFIEVGKGGAQPNISQGIIKSWPIFLPPFNEQKRIVAKIEELFSELDKGVENLQKAQAQLKIYRQALLKHAFEGRLTAQWRAEHQHQLETGAQLVARIYQERQERFYQEVEAWEKGGKQGKKPAAPKELPPLTPEELAELPALPAGWAWERLVHVADLIGGVTKGKNLDGKIAISVPYLRVANVQEGYLDLSEIKLIEVEKGDEIKYQLKYGDILYTEGGDKDKLGRGTVWNNQIKLCIHQNHIFRARLFNEDLIPNFVALFSQTKSAKKYFFRHAKQTTNLASINLGVLSRFPIPVMDKSEQNQILNLLESKLSVIAQLEQTIAENLQKAEVLRQAILHKAFSGRLVPQDPQDEPAHLLLQRLHAQKQSV